MNMFEKVMYARATAEVFMEDIKKYSTEISEKVAGGVKDASALVKMMSEVEKLKSLEIKDIPSVDQLKIMSDVASSLKTLAV